MNSGRIGKCRCCSRTTLQLEAVQLSTFGRLLQGAPDELVGFVQSAIAIHDAHVVAVSGKSEHVIVSSNGREVV